jgi:hypothetical protein
VIVFDETGKTRENVTFTGITFDDGKWYTLVARRRVTAATVSVNGDYIGQHDT